ncbi:MAG: signal peptidase I [Terracidiphilus sp.]
MSDLVRDPDPVSAQASHRPPIPFAELHGHLPTIPQALASLMQTVVVAMFVLTFVVQPLLIPSESMEHTLLVGDFLLFDKQTYAPPGALSRWFMPYRDPARGDIIVFRHPYPPMLIKRVVGLPGDRLRIVDGHAFINDVALPEPYAAFGSPLFVAGGDSFPGKIYPGPQVDPEWWHQMQGLTRNGELTVPPGEYFVLGDNRNHSWDSRYWGFVPRDAVVGRPLVIYFSLNRSIPIGAGPPSQGSAQPPADDRLGHERELAAKIEGFARWRRIFHVVH